VEDTQEAMGALSWGLGDGYGQDVSPDQREQMAQMLATDPNLRRLLQEMGRVLRMASAKRRTEVKHVREAVCDVGLGADLGVVLPSELALLDDGDEMLELDFYRRMAEGQLLTYQFRGRESAARGPLVVCLDVSGSMRGGGKMTTAAAVTLAMAHTALRGDREAVVIPFAGTPHDPIEFTRGTVLKATLAVARIGCGGGTSWEEPLTVAREAIERRGGQWESADVVLVTDGICDVSQGFTEDFAQWRKLAGVTSYGMLIGSTAKTAPRQLRRVTDKASVVGSMDELRDKGASVVRDLAA
jgi:uncharacterized protein with von Willebrand factor type A (vWA) domain